MKILVTTDFSDNSKGAIRFVRSLVKQSEAIEVVFYHAVTFMKPSLWSDSYFLSYKKQETERLIKLLKRFVLPVLGADKTKFRSINFVIDNVLSTEKDIVKYAEKGKFSFICIATQGAGILRKIVGTHASHIINHSRVPVLVVPSHYRSRPLKKITYLSDFENLNSELGKLSKTANAINCPIEVLHYSSSLENKSKLERRKSLLEKSEYKHVVLKIVNSDFESSLVDRVSQFVEKSKPDLLVMFTRKEKSFFESIFLPSKSAELTYTTKVPVLIFAKK